MSEQLEIIRSLLSYNAAKGTFRWKKDRGHGVRAGDLAGCVLKDGYRYIRVAGKRWRAARLAWLMYYREPPPSLIDHKNRKRSDDRIKNLRPATVANNAANANSHRDGSSGEKGVFWERGIGKWRASITRHGKREHLGCFTTVMAAAAAYRKRSRELDGEFAAARCCRG